MAGGARIPLILPGLRGMRKAMPYNDEVGLLRRRVDGSPADERLYSRRDILYPDNFIRRCKQRDIQSRNPHSDTDGAFSASAVRTARRHCSH